MEIFIVTVDSNTGKTIDADRVKEALNEDIDFELTYTFEVKEIR